MDTRKKTRLESQGPDSTAPDQQFEPRVECILFGDGTLVETRWTPGATSPPPPREGQVLWIRVVGVHDRTLMRQVADCFGLDDDLLDDVLDTARRPLYAELDHGMIVIIKSIDFDTRTQTLRVTQESLLMREQLVITFQEREHHSWDEFLKRLRKGRHLFKSDPHYLVFSLMDTIMDRYLLSLGSMADILQDLEEKLMDVQTQETMFEMYRIKRETAFLRKHIWPLREVVQGLAHKKNSKRLSDYGRDVLCDVKEDVKEVIDLLNTLDHVIAGLIDLNSNIADMTMNRIMKVLTVMGTIFLPLTFITSLYGMNFSNMPELQWRDGYYLVLGLMLCIASAMVYFFRRKKWI